MGDVCTITLLALISDFLFKQSDGNYWLPGTALVVLLMFAPIMGYIARKNRYTRSVILTGWTPILGAVILEQPGGIVMENAFDKYDVLSTFQPLVNGIANKLFLHEIKFNNKFNYLFFLIRQN
jgi:solute carrier family 41